MRISHVSTAVLLVISSFIAQVQAQTTATSDQFSEPSAGAQTQFLTVPNAQPQLYSASLARPRVVCPGGQVIQYLKEGVAGTPAHIVERCAYTREQYLQLTAAAPVPTYKVPVVRPSTVQPQTQPVVRPSVVPARPAPATIAPVARYPAQPETLPRSQRRAAPREDRPLSDIKVLASVDLSEQKMRVYVNNKLWHTWDVSSGRHGYRTPTGTWGVTRMHKTYYSRTYNNAPMPYSIFFHRGYAIHGTNSIKRLGRPASHGCIRLAPWNAKKLFEMTQVYGRQNLTVKIKS